MFRRLNWPLSGISYASRKKISYLGRLQVWSSIFNRATFKGLYTTYVIGFRYAVKMCSSHENGRSYLTLR